MKNYDNSHWNTVYQISAKLSGETTLFGQITSSDHVDGLVQERRNSSVLAVELHLSCTNPLIWKIDCLLTNDLVKLLYNMRKI